MTDVAKKIVEMRKRHGLSQHRLAILLGTTAAAVSRWETGNRVPSSIAVTALELLDEKLTREQDEANRAGKV
jgi:DNA-binding transcriptional regulator YiaG